MDMANGRWLDNPFRDERIMRIRDGLKERNEVKVGAWFLVRVPRVAGRIFLRKESGGRTYVELIYKQQYDPEKKQMRNRKVCVGQLLDWIPGAMIPNEKYYEWFDRETGEMKAGEERTGKNEAAGMDGAADNGPDGEPTLRTAGEETHPAGEENRPAGKLRDVIEKVLERENLIQPSERRMQERMRAEWAKEICDAEAGEQTVTEMGQKEPVPTGQRKRMRILLDILTSLRDVIRDQARKRPEGIVNRFQARKINSVLEEIREMEERKGLGDLLELIREPEESVNEEGKTVITGMTYSDAEVIMEYYNSVIWFTQGDRELS